MVPRQMPESNPDSYHRHSSHHNRASTIDAAPMYATQMHAHFQTPSAAATDALPRWHAPAAATDSLQIPAPDAADVIESTCSCCSYSRPITEVSPRTNFLLPTSFPAIVNAFATQPFYWLQGAEVVTSCTRVLPEGVRGHQTPPYPKPYPRLEGRPGLIARRARRRRRRQLESARNWQRRAAYGGTPGRRHRRPRVHL